MRLRISGNYKKNGTRFLIGYEESNPTVFHGFEGTFAGKEEILAFMRREGVYREADLGDQVLASGPTHQECIEALEELVTQD